MTYSPFMSVAAPMDEPWTTTFAPMRGSPVSASVTHPRILPAPLAAAGIRAATTKRVNNSLNTFPSFMNHASFT